MPVLVMIAGMCVAAVLFMLRFFVALCRECEPGLVGYIVRVEPHTGGDEPDASDETKQLDLVDHHTVRRRWAGDSSAATTTPWSAVTVASSAMWGARKGASATTTRVS